MRNKNAIVFFTVVLSLLCLFFLSFTFVTRRIEADADRLATTKEGNVDRSKRQLYLDSLSKVPIYLGYNYDEIKEKEINLGLDLQGGMHITLEVSPVEIVRSMAGNSKDPAFLASLRKATEKQKTSQRPFAELFYESFRETAGGVKLASVFSNAANKDRINFNTPDAQVTKVIQEEIDGAIDRSYEILRNRIDKFGVVQPNIQKLPGTGRIQIELPGVDEPERVRRLLSGVARLEFCEVWEPQPVFAALQTVNDSWVRREAVNRPRTKAGAAATATGLDALRVRTDSVRPAAAPGDSSVAPSGDTLKGGSSLEQQLAAKGDSARKDSGSAQLSPLFSLLKSDGYGGLAYDVNDTARINRILQDSQSKSLIPTGMVFLWGGKADEAPDGKLNTLRLYAVKRDRDGKAALSGDVITDARISFEQGGAGVSMQMSTTGAKKWKNLTAANIKRPVAIVLDNYVQSAPIVQNEIPNGSSSITGNFTADEAKDLANKLKAGKLPAPTRIVEEEIVGASLGQDSIQQGLLSAAAGVLVVFLFMWVYYSYGGIIANITLLINIFFSIGVLAQLGAVLTLSGIAGIVLTIGMSVDANVLIYERLREELRSGKPMGMAIKLGFDKAYSSIIDSNATTFLIGAILYTMGSGGVKGFAVTLMIGIVCNLFSAVFINRLLIEAISRYSRKPINFNSYFFQNTFKSTNFDFVGMRKKAYLFSGAIIVLGLGLIIAQGGLSLGVDFKGGRSYIVQFSEAVPVGEVRSELSKTIPAATEVKTFGSTSQLKITTSYLIEEESEQADKKVADLFLQGLAKFKDRNPTIVSSSKVGATIADDIKSTSQNAVLVSLVVMFIFILVRFKNWEYGLVATISLFHNVLIVLAFLAFARLFGITFELDQVLIAAMLTVIGYSINDTVVVFDRIREFAGDITHSDFARQLNGSINDTLSRTVVTGTTTILVVIILLAFAGDVLRGFSYAMLVGIVFGTYSSIFVAAPMLLDLSRRKTDKTVPKQVASRV
ncbi:MAG: protein translocase subunit SecDF [Ferruginibacter sp.]|nr:protein translocase subunit SecDF [Cytophagales bacterium]